MERTAIKRPRHAPLAKCRHECRRFGFSAPSAFWACSVHRKPADISHRWSVAGKVGLLAYVRYARCIFRATTRRMINGDRHDSHFDGSHPLPSNYRAYRQSVHVRLVQLPRQHPGCGFLEIGVGPASDRSGSGSSTSSTSAMWAWTSNMVCAQGEPIWRRPASPIETTPFWEMRQEHTCSTRSGWRGIERLSTSSISTVAIRSMSIWRPLSQQYGY